MNRIVFLLFSIIFAGIINAQNVGINATGAAAHSSAGLDVNFTDKGFLIPRVALTALNSASPISSPTVSLLVYNTATAGSTPNNVVPGYYYWDGSVWVAISGTGGRDWSLLGNAGTTAGTNFLGTTDAVDFVVKTNGSERMRVLSAGNVGIGIASPASRLSVLAGAADGSGTAAMGIGFQYDATFTRAGIYADGSSGYGGILHFATNNGANNHTVTSKMTILANGNLGIGTTTPVTKLHINNEVSDDNGFSYDANSLMVVHQTATGTAILNDPKTALVLARQGTFAQAYGAGAAFNLSRYENNGVNSRTRLDISLAHTSFDLTSNNIMTLLSSGAVGIGGVSPTAKLDVNSVGNSAGAIALQLRGGNGSGTYTSNQITFGYNGTDQYRHAIKTRHNGGSATDNAFDFYIWAPPQSSTDIGTGLVMTLDGGVKVGFGAASPASSNAWVGQVVEIDNNIGDWNAAINLSTYGTISNPSCILEFTNRSQTSGDKRTGQITCGRNNASTTQLEGSMSFATTHLGVLTDKMYITGQGNVGIGIWNPSYLLDVQGGDINASGSVRSAGVALTSDARLKKNIVNLENGLTSVMKLRPVSYQKKTSIESTDYSKEEIGFIAQEVQTIFPQLVTEGKDKDKTLALDYVSLIPVLTKAIQEQQNQINILKKENDFLKEQNEEILRTLKQK